MENISNNIVVLVLLRACLFEEEINFHQKLNRLTVYLRNYICSPKNKSKSFSKSNGTLHIHNSLPDCKSA